MQRSQSKPQELTVPQEEEEERVEEEEDDDDEVWSQNIYSLNRTSNGRSVSPPHKQSLRHPHRESVAQKSLVLQPSKQAQIVKTNTHLGSTQVSSSRPTNTKSPSQYAPSSPIPSRHISSVLKAGPGIDISPLPNANTDAGRHEIEDLHHVQVHSSLDGTVLSVTCGAQELRKDPSMRVSSSTSSLASSSSLSDKGPDVRIKDKPKISQTGSVEYKPRPFMGIMDKTARFQPPVPVPRGWQSHSTEGLVASGEIVFAKPSGSYYEQLKGPAINGSLHAKEFCRKEPKPVLAMAHSFTDSVQKQPASARENTIHVASIKPKRSFIESNV